MTAVDVPREQLEAEVIAVRFQQAAEHTNSPSDRLAFYLDARLVRDQAPVSTDDDYPGWAEHIAALQTACKETNR